MNATKIMSSLTKTGPLVKICGLTSLKDALLATELGASALGFVLYPPSPRAIHAKLLAQITTQLPTNIAKVGVFVNADKDEMLTIAEQASLTHLQLHGNESPETVKELLLILKNKKSPLKLIKALRLNTPHDLKILNDYSGVRLLIDADLVKQDSRTIWGGSGEKANWELARQAAEQAPVLLAGGLNPENIVSAWQTVKPFGLDLSSGLEERPGVKDTKKMRHLFQILSRAKSDSKTLGTVKNNTLREQTHDRR